MNQGVTVVTGASRGIGRAIADLLASKGHRIVNLSRSAPAKPFPGESVAVDLADTSACAACLSELKQKYEVEHLVNNAAVIEVSEIEKISIEQFERLSALNLRAALQCVMAFAPAMSALTASAAVCTPPVAAMEHGMWPNIAAIQRRRKSSSSEVESDKVETTASASMSMSGW